MSGQRDFIPKRVWVFVWAADAYWWVRRKLQHVRWLAGIVGLGRVAEKEDRDG